MNLNLILFLLGFIPVLSFSQSRVDIISPSNNVCYRGEWTPFSYVYINKESSPIKIEEIPPRMDIKILDYDRLVAPGDTGTIVGELKVNQCGKRSITFWAGSKSDNGKNNPSGIYCSQTWYAQEKPEDYFGPEIEMEESIVDFGNVPPGKIYHHSIRIKNIGKEPFPCWGYFSPYQNRYPKTIYVEFSKKTLAPGEEGFIRIYCKGANWQHTEIYPYLLHNSNCKAPDTLFIHNKNSRQDSILPEITFLNPYQQLGHVEPGRPITIKFDFKNTGSVPFIFETVKASGPVASQYQKEQIMPGELGVITGAFMTRGKQGTQHKTLTVRVRGIPTPFLLRFRTEISENETRVLSPIFQGLTDTLFNCGNLKPESIRRFTIPIENTGMEYVQINLELEKSLNAGSDISGSQPRLRAVLLHDSIAMTGWKAIKSWHKWGISPGFKGRLILELYPDPALGPSFSQYYTLKSNIPGDSIQLQFKGSFQHALGEASANYRGGEKALVAYLNANIDPKIRTLFKAPLLISAKVMISPQGEFKSLDLEDNVPASLAIELYRLLSNSQNWIPASKAIPQRLASIPGTQFQYVEDEFPFLFKYIP